MQRVVARAAERSFGVLVSMLVAPTGTFESHTYLCVYPAWHMNSLWDLGPLSQRWICGLSRSFVDVGRP